MEWRYRPGTIRRSARPVSHLNHVAELRFVKVELDRLLGRVAAKL